MARRCIFCEGRPGSGEHAFPDWLNDVYAQLPLEHVEGELPRWARGRVDTRIGDVWQHEWDATQIASLRCKKLCHECNTGWMSRLESRTRPLLEPMILGRPHTLSASGQITVATWAVKTVMVLEVMMGEESEEDFFSVTDRQIVMNQDRPPGLVGVYSACIEGRIPPARYACARVQGYVDEVAAFRIQLYTLQMNTLVLQVIRRDPPPTNYGALRDVAVPQDIEVPLFPPVEGFFWPPKLSLDLSSLERYIARDNSLPARPGFPVEPPERSP